MPRPLLSNQPDLDPGSSRKANSLEDILAMDGQGSISIRPRAPGDAPLIAANSKHPAAPEAEIDITDGGGVGVGAGAAPEAAVEAIPSQQSTPIAESTPITGPATEASPVFVPSPVTEAGVKNPDDQSRSPAARLKAALAQRQAHQTRQETNVAEHGNERPVVQRVVEPKAVAYQAAKTKFDHVKIPALKQTSQQAPHHASASSKNIHTGRPAPPPAPMAAPIRADALAPAEIVAQSATTARAYGVHTSASLSDTDTETAVDTRLPPPINLNRQCNLNQPGPHAPTHTASGLAAFGHTGFGPLQHLPQTVREKLRAFIDRSAETSPPLPPLSAHAAQAAPEAQAEQAASTATAPSCASASAATAPQLQNNTHSELKRVIFASSRAFWAAAIFSMVINLLMLTGPLFMLQVYDRVMASGSMATLSVLFAMTVLLYGVLGALELARSRIIVRIGVDVDQRIGARVFQAALKRALMAPQRSQQTLRELDHLRSFLAGPGPLTFFDVPWAPIYLLIIFALHWVLGLAATIGAIALMGLALLSEIRSRAPMSQATQSAAVSLTLGETGQRNAQTLAALGMASAYRDRWQAANRQTLAWQVLVADRLGSSSALSKTLRLLMQSAMLAIGAALALQNEISAGTIVAASIIFGRALSPVEQAIAQWRPFSRARLAYNNLNELLQQNPPPPQVTSLPRPDGHLAVENLRVAAPDTHTLILSNLNFCVSPGQMLAIIGPSASGKSTLARCLVGLWPAIGGAVKIDGARLDQWQADDLGKFIGYLPQCVELFAGTVKDNISRFQADATDASVIAAARMAHAHDMITSLPQGYDTQLGDGAHYLSGGQRQRIGLARALFGEPAVIILDEPNANLDRRGDDALNSAIDGMRARGQAVVLISHRVGALSRADLILYLDRGVQRAFGPHDDVMKLLQGQCLDTAPAAPADQTSAPATPPPSAAPEPVSARPATTPATTSGTPLRASSLPILGRDQTAT